MSVSASFAGPAALLVATGSAIAVARQDPATSLEPLEPTVLVVAAVGAVSAVTTAWLVRREHPYVSLGLSATAIGLLVPLCAGWSGLPDSIRAAALGATPIAVAGAAQIPARWTNGRSALMNAVWVLVGVAVIVHVIAYDPFADPACRRTCKHIQPLAAEIISTRQAVVAATALTVIAGLLGLIAVARNIRSAPPSVVASVWLTVAVLTSTAVWHLLTGGAFARSSRSAAVAAVALAAIAVPVLRVALRPYRTRRAVDRLVSRLGDPPSTVEFAIPGESRWVDAAGRAVNDVDGDRLELADASGLLARLQIQSGNDRVDVMKWLTPAAQLSLRNAQLAAVANARLFDVQASRRRIVEASDAERQRIERDLHDGAQQRLVSAAFQLTMARRRLPEHDADVADAEQSVREALRNLRDLAHGIFPAVLVSEGLRAGVEDLLANVDLPTSLEVSDGLTIPIESAMAAHATVAAALEAAIAAAATRARVAIDRIDAILDVRIESDAPAPHRSDLVHLIDRVGAVGGELRILTTSTGSVVMAEIPCAS